MAALRRSWVRQVRGARGKDPWSASIQIARSLLRRAARETRRLTAPVLERIRSREPSSHGVEGLPGAPGSGVAAALEDLEARAMAESLAASFRISLAYQPRPVDVAVLCFEAGTDGLYAGSWEGVATRGLTVRTTGGEHLEMMENPLVVEVAAQVNQALWGSGPSARAG